MKHRAWSVGVALLILLPLGVLAWWRTGLLDLPSAPAETTLASSGLANLASMKRLDEFVRFGGVEPRADETISEASLDAARRVKEGLALIARGDVENGLTVMREGVRPVPGDLVLANVYRMTVFELRRAWLRSAKQSGALIPEFPAHLKDEPIAFFRELADRTGAREAKLHHALAWVDHMLLFPALEIKAPSSVEAVRILNELLQGEGLSYVPALFARGLNHLHRPARLVWPETTDTPRDAAAQDLGRCVAIGRRLGVGSPRLKATLMLALGDAHVKADRPEAARSWWQLTRNQCHDDDIRQAVRRRFGWSDGEVLDRLEEELDRARSALDQPMTDLALMWTGNEERLTKSEPRP